MKSKHILLLTACLLYSCQNPQSGTSEYFEDKTRETVSNRQEEANIAEIRPQLEQMSSAAKSALEVKKISLPNFKGAPVETLLLWSDGDQWPVMLEVNYLNNAANPKAVYYFRDRKLIAVEKNSANFTFKRNKMQVWADEKWHPLKDKNTDQWLDQENYLLNNAKKYLDAFEINYED